VLRVGPRLDRKGLIERIKTDELIASLGWLGLSEAMLRVVRVATTIVVARHLTPLDFGLAATVIALFELVRVFSRAGMMPALVAVKPDRFEATARTVFKLAIIACVFSAIVLIAAGGILAERADRPELLGLAAILAATFFLQPFGVVQEVKLQREGRLKIYGAIAAAQIIAESIIAAGLAIAGYGVWSLIVAKLLSMPVWLLAVRKSAPWQWTPGETVSPRALGAYAAPVLGSDLLAALRMHADKAIVGALIGLEALGIYAFAFNAGFGLSLTITSALATAAFAHLARAHHANRDVVAAFDHCVKTAVLPVAALILLQAAAAYIYVPILFGAKWAFAAPYVALFCLAAVTKPLFDGAAQLLRVVGRPQDELVGGAVVTAVILALIAIAAFFGLMPAVIAFAVAATAGHIIFAIWARRRVVACGVAHV
jgi:teichuronic acid exporter